MSFNVLFTANDEVQQTPSNPSKYTTPSKPSKDTFTDDVHDHVASSGMLFLQLLYILYLIQVNY